MLDHQLYQNETEEVLPRLTNMELYDTQGFDAI